MNGSITPSPLQLAFHNMEFGMFLHFGLRSWYERLGDKDVHTMDPKRFTPAHFDCRQWAETAKAAGMKYMVLTAKHHDGWCNWQTATSDFSVKSSPWERQGRRGPRVYRGLPRRRPGRGPLFFASRLDLRVLERRQTL